ALRIVERTGERWFEAELCRHKGQLLLRQGHDEAAEKLSRKALSIAQAQEAKLWELRAAVSLTRLWRNHGRHDEARVLRGPMYGSLTEGFDGPALKEAKVLRGELDVQPAGVASTTSNGKAGLDWAGGCAAKSRSPNSA